MTYRNIDSILVDSITIIRNEPPERKKNLYDPPQAGEEARVKTFFEEKLQVEIHTVIDGGNKCQGTAKHDIYKGEVGNMELVIADGERIEFSRSRIHGISQN
jgi:hypothetical protein